MRTYKEAALPFTNHPRPLRGHPSFEGNGPQPHLAQSEIGRLPIYPICPSKMGK